MTACVAALCENGQKVVVATDCRLSYGGIASDALPGKMFWFGDWLFLYAGLPSHVELINEELRHYPPLARETISETILASYRKAKAKFCAHAVLSHYDLTMDEFKAQGLKMFGPKVFSQLSGRLDAKEQEFNEYLLIVGYGKEQNAGNIFQIGPETLDSFALTGATAIGSGQDVALSTLTSLGQNRSCSLSNTLYAVAAAKFSAEMSQVGDEKDYVGKTTAMYVAWKRTENDKPEKPPGDFIQQDEITSLRATWEQYGRPKIPFQSAEALWPIVSRLRLARSEAHTPDDMKLRLSVEHLRERRAIEAEAGAQIHSDRDEES
ncbi:MAG: hypothetical protein ABSB50_14910 [Terracidiphilus sp.]|jgi:hypothetical protein